MEDDWGRLVIEVSPSATQSSGGIRCGGADLDDEPARDPTDGERFLGFQKSRTYKDKTRAREKVQIRNIHESKVMSRNYRVNGQGWDFMIYPINGNSERQGIPFAKEESLCPRKNRSRGIFQTELLANPLEGKAVMDRAHAVPRLRINSNLFGTLRIVVGGEIGRWRTYAIL